MNQIDQEAISLLQQLIKCPSFSREEEQTAATIFDFLNNRDLHPIRKGNNIVATYQGADPKTPFVLLCSHHDTVKPNAGYQRDPFDPMIEGDKLFGLGANDAGASLVSLIAVFNYFAKQKSHINLILAAVAEEEISGAGGVSSILAELPDIALAVVGEPTSLEMAVAEKGLVVIDGLAEGVPGHAAHDNSINPISQACADIGAIHAFDFDRVSPFLGKTKANVTVINAGEQHNQVPATCRFVIDVRVNEKYTLEEVVTLLQSKVKSSLKPRSLRLRSSGISANHRVFTIAKKLKLNTYGSATLSDQALLPYPSIKMGPGDTLRSHSADEFIYLREISDGIKLYIEFLHAYTELQ
jgi:acetylornithine deacetylase